jgi:GNAT superfamily N-acetyltransferase
MIRAARPDDVPVILDFIRGLARYEKLEHELDLDAARLREHLFGVVPACGAFLAEQEGPVGFALWCTSYSTFKTRAFVHLEDLFVLPGHRGHGHGLALLRAVAGEAVRRGAPRLQWNVLDWNASAIAFYESQGAELLPDWRSCRVSGPALAKLAGGRQ